MTTLDGRYSLGDRLGGGATAEVFRAHDTRLGRDVAVKVFHRASALPDARGRLESEVRLLASLSHPHLVALYDAEVGDEPYVVMELVEGASLHQVMLGGPVEPGRVARLGAEIAAALAYVHSRGVVHRDVKPGNVLLTVDDHAKVADFGIARIVDDAGMTQAGLVVGTAAYLAPEQVRGRQVTTAADVYSLGLVLLEALTGHREYDGPAAEAAGARLQRAPTIPTSLGGRWPSLLAAMTATDPGERPDANEVSRRLRPEGVTGVTATTAATRVVAPPAATSVLPPVVVPYEPEPPRRRGWTVAAVLLGLLAVAAVAVVLATRHTGSPAVVPTTPATTAASTATTPPETTSAPPTTSSSSSSPTPTPTTPSTSAPVTSPTTPPPTTAAVTTPASASVTSPPAATSSAAP